MIDGVACNRGQRRTLDKLVACLSSLNLEIVAEGVERNEDAQVVWDAGIQFAQGYLWGRPTLVELDYPKSLG